jgi:hypothetical protein
MIPIRPRRRGALIRVAVCGGAALLAACSAPEASEAADAQPEPAAPSAAPDRAASAESPVLGQTGLPGPRLPSDAAPAERTQVISKVELAEAFKRPDKVGCLITFAYRGFTPDQALSDTPCSELHVAFVDRQFLEKQNDWERLDSFQQDAVTKLPDGKVLYLEGEFAAAIYPIGLTGTIEEIWVSD